LFPHGFAGAGEFKSFVRQADGLNETQHVASSANLAAADLPDKTTGFSLFFIVFQCGFGESFCRPPVDARLKNFATRRKQGGFTPVCRFRATEKGKSKRFGLDNRGFWQLKSSVRKMLTMKNDEIQVIVYVKISS
jgi:hypothetical protein